MAVNRRTVPLGRGDCLEFFGDACVVELMFSAHAKKHVLIPCTCTCSYVCVCVRTAEADGGPLRHGDHHGAAGVRRLQQVSGRSFAGTVPTVRLFSPSFLCYWPSKSPELSGAMFCRQKVANELNEAILVSQCQSKGDSLSLLSRTLCVTLY